MTEQPKKIILIFDENPIADDLLIRELKRRGYENVRARYSEIEACSKRIDYGAIIVRFPDTNDREMFASAIRGVKTIKETIKGLPFIVLSSLESYHEARRELKHHANVISTSDYPDYRIVEIVESCLRTVENQKHP